MTWVVEAGEPGPSSGGDDGLWRGYVSLEIDPQTGRRKRAHAVRSTQREVAQ